MMWDVSPWEELETLRKRLDNAFSRMDRAGGGYSFPLVNVYDRKDELVVAAEMPGLKKEAIKIVLESGVLTLSGKRNPLVPDEKAELLRSERSEGDFEKSFRLPCKVEENKISAAYTNGVLTISIPKAEEAKPKSITVDVK